MFTGSLEEIVKRKISNQRIIYPSKRIIRSVSRDLNCTPNASNAKKQRTARNESLENENKNFSDDDCSGNQSEYSENEHYSSEEEDDFDGKEKAAQIEQVRILEKKLTY